MKKYALLAIIVFTATFALTIPAANIVQGHHAKPSKVGQLAGPLALQDANAHASGVYMTCQFAMERVVINNLIYPYPSRCSGVVETGIGHGACCPDPSWGYRYRAFRMTSSAAESCWHSNSSGSVYRVSCGSWA